MTGADAVDLDYLRSWIGRACLAEDVIDAWHAAAMHATLDLPGAPPGPGAALPPGWHWLYFREAVAAGGLGRDGHAARGDFLPPVPLDRRLWAGGRLTFHAPLPVGAPATRRSTVHDVRLKHGVSGPLVFVTVRHEIAAADTPAVSEDHDIVYRDAAQPGGKPRRSSQAPPPVPALWQRAVTPDAPLLFRYSALTFNGHRIHYDADYCRAVEGYPGPVVHGPLVATLLLDLLRRNLPGARIGTFAFRAHAPLFCGEQVLLSGSLGDEANGEAVLAANGPGGRLIMSASARIGPDAQAAT